MKTINLKKFPHISRKLTAAILATFLLTAVSFNLLQNWLFGQDLEKNLKQQVLRYPYISSLHEKLGQFYLDKDVKLAEREYRLAEEFFQNTPSYDMKVLGRISSPWQTWLNIISRKEDINQEIDYWEKVDLLYPSYLYAKVKLAYLYYQAGNKEKALFYVSEVIRENPFDKTALVLREKIK